jgi:hypothetical protein
VREEIATASGISEGAWKRFQAAAALLEFFASGVQAGDGDGPALPKPVCSCGVLTDAYLIETTVQNIYKKANALTRDPPKISYQTMVIEDAKQALAPFRLAGHADISSNPRSVIITIEEVNLRALDLCQLAYVLFHELICHGFQAVGNSVRENALDTCHWSEGWMDATAFEIALKWVTEGGTSHPRPPLTGQKGRDAIWEQHRARYADKSYVAGSKVSKNIAQWRNAAREALARLRKAFVENEMAKNAQDAAELVENFVLMANAHPGANPAILRRVSEHLIALLLSKEWPSETAAAASPCRNFLDHRDLAVLEKALQGAVEERRTRRISPNALMRQMHAR